MHALEILQDALEKYAKFFGEGKYPETLDALVINQLLDEIPTDGWMLPIDYSLDKIQNEYTLDSTGIDKLPTNFNLLQSAAEYLHCSSAEDCLKSIY